MKRISHHLKQKAILGSFHIKNFDDKELKGVRKKKKMNIQKAKSRKNLGVI